MNNQSLHCLVARSANNYANRPAVVFDDGECCSKKLTYIELWQFSQEVALELSTLGAKNNIIGVIQKDDVHFPGVLLSISLNNCCFYPLGISSPLDYTVEALKAVGVSYILAHDDDLKVLNPILNLLFYDDETSENLKGFSLRFFHLQQHKDQIFTQKHESCDGLGYCITTSGTTNKPKIVRVPHACITPNILHLRQIFQLSPNDRVLLTSPLTFDPSIIDIFCALSSGACLVIVPQELKQRPEKLLEVLHKRQRITFMQATPSLMRTFKPERLSCTILGDNSSLKVLALGGEQFPSGSELCAWFHPENNTDLFNLYGITEISCWASCQRVCRKTVIKNNTPVSIGQPLDRTLVKLVPLLDADKSPANHESDIGHIIIGSSERVCIIDNEDPQTLVNSPVDNVVWRNTGDIGRAGDNGDIFYIGRLDSQIKRHGKRINLSAIEEVIKEIPCVSSCCMLHHKSSLVAFVLVESRARLHQADINVMDWSQVKTKLETHVAEKLPKHARPDIFFQMEGSFPTTSHGKLDRTRLLQMIDVRLDQTFRDLSQNSMQSIWKEHLPRSSHDVLGCDNFLSMGGDSLSAVRLATTLEAVSSLSMAQIYDVLVNKTFSDLLKLFQNSQPSFQHMSYSEQTSEYKTSKPESHSVYQETSSHEPQKNLGHSKKGSTSILKDAADKRKFEHDTNTLVQEKLFISNTKLIKVDNHCLQGPQRNLEDSFKSDCPNISEDNVNANLISDGAVNESCGLKRICTPGLSASPHHTNTQSDFTDFASNSVCCSNTYPVARRIIQRGGKIININNIPALEYCDHQSCGTRSDYQRVNTDDSDPHPCHNTDDSDPHPCHNTVDSDPHPCHEKSSGYHMKHVNIRKDEQKDEIKLVINTKWLFDTNKCVDASPLVVQYSNHTRVFICSHSGLVCCLELNTGECVWSTSLPDRVESSACCTVDGHHVIVGCYDGNIYTLCASSGHIVWRVQTGDAVKCSPIVIEALSYILCGSHDGFLYCLDTKGKVLLWQTNLQGGSVFASPALSTDCQTVFAATLAGNVVALDVRTGKINWKMELHKPVFASLCVKDNCVYVGCVDGKLYSISNEGDKNWTFQAGAPIFSAPVYDNDHILFGCHDFCLYCLKPEGKLVWKYKATATLYSTPFPFKIIDKQHIKEKRGTSHDKLKNARLHNDSKAVRQIDQDEPFSHVGDGNQFDKTDDIITDSFKSNLNSKHCPEQGITLSATGKECLPQQYSINCAVDSTYDDVKHTQPRSEQNFAYPTAASLLQHDNADICCVAVASTDGKLMVLNMEDGSLLESHHLPGQVFSSPIVVDHYIIIGCRDNNVYCMGIT